MTSILTRVTVGLLDPHECDVLGSIFFNAVHKGAKAFYSDKQCQAWAPSIPSGQDWAGRLMSQRTIVARLEGEPIGFMTLDDTGYIDLAFVDRTTNDKVLGRSFMIGSKTWHALTGSKGSTQMQVISSKGFLSETAGQSYANSR